MTAIHIQGLGTYVPTKRITNVDLMSLVDTNDEWIVSRTGIKARHMLADDENGSDAGTEAALKALNAGIRIIEQEESYTSKADLIANDRIPTYGVDDKDASFSGKRIKRGLYRCSNGMILNADCHAAANIMRKVIPDIWKDTRDYTFLSAPDVYGFHKLNPKGIPVKGIAA